MATNSKIAWTHHTFNPWVGCAKVHTGCTNCYAEDYANRYGRAVWGVGGTRSVTSPANWAKVQKWDRWARTGVCLKCEGKGHIRRKETMAGEEGQPVTMTYLDACEECENTGKVEPYRARVFCASLADIFEKWDGGMLAHDGDELRVCGHATNDRGCGWSGTLPLIVRSGSPAKSVYDCPACGLPTFLMPMDDVRRRVFDLIDSTPNLDWLLLTKRPENITDMWPTPPAHIMATNVKLGRHGSYRQNCRLGTSISDQPTADKYLSELVKCRELAPVLFASAEPLLGKITFRWAKWQPLGKQPGAHTDEYDGLRKIDQVIIGNESDGKRVGRLGFDSAREWHAAAEAMVAECLDAKVSAFVKQIPQHGLTCHDIEEYPAGLQYRQIPNA
jgi:protein gp37